MSDDRCPYCCKVVHFELDRAERCSGRESYSLRFCVSPEGENEYEVYFYKCPGCAKTHVRAKRPISTTTGFPTIGGPILRNRVAPSEDVGPSENTQTRAPDTFVLWPMTGGRTPADSTVPSDIAADYNEACAVLNVSPQSCAALARRILQRLLVANETVNAKDTLDRQINAAMEALPKYLAENLHYLRGVGNFAAHAQQAVAGAIVKVDQTEAEAALDVIEALFEHYYTSPAKAAKVRGKFKAEKVTPTGNRRLADTIPE